MFIDIHCHSYLWHTCPHLELGTDCLSTPEHLVKRYDAVGIEKGVLLPVCTIENVITPQCNEEILHIAEKFPGRFIPFCNLDPRALYNSPYSPLDKVLAYYKTKGCKGIGEVTAAQFLAEIGDIERFKSAGQLIAYAGTDPGISQSGTSLVRKHISKKGNSSLRRVVFLMALHVIKFNEVFREYFYKKTKLENMNGKKAVVAVANKLLRCIFAMLKNKKLFSV